MRKIMVIALALSLALLAIGCSEDRLTDPAPIADYESSTINGLDPEILAASMIQTAGWNLDEDVDLPDKINMMNLHHSHHFPSFTREVITGNIAHYTFEVRTGCGENDIIRIHRVVKERRPYRPIRAEKNLFMVHGDGSSFEVAFLMNTVSDAQPVDHAMPVFLAQNDVDVWGIDLGWTLVPAETEDLSFMADWGLQKDVDDLRLAAGIARFTRLFTCGDRGKLNLLGWSRGGMSGYAYLNEESQRPEWRRHIGGYIPTDIWYKTETYLEEECAYAADLQGMIDEGMLADDTGAFLGWMVDLARTEPDAVSPVFGEPFTNLMAALAFGSQTYLVSPTPAHYHIMAGTFDADGLPVGFQHAETDLWLDFVGNWSPYEPLLMELETELAVCGDPAHPVPFDDHLGDITIPVFFLGAQGGFGEEGLYTLGMLGSTDVSSHIVSFNGDIFNDFAHADLFNANNAQTVAWEPVLDWIMAH